MNVRKIHPLPGCLIVRLEGLYKNAGLIAIPQRYEKATKLIGIVTDISMRPEDQRVLGVDLKIGDRIIVTNLGGRFLAENTWIYPITLKRKDEYGRKYMDSSMLAVVDHDVDMAPHSQAIERCAWCGPVHDSHQNVILFNGICPRCGKTAQGEIPSPQPVRVGDDQIGALHEAEREAMQKIN